MKFEVPQFIEVEDKVFGPFTFKQFVYLAGGAGLAVVIWVFVPRFIGIPLIAAVVGLAAALAFYKINEKPFVFFLESMIRFYLAGKLYIWKKEERTVKKKSDPTALETGLTVPRLSDSKLRDLAWSLDVHDSLYGEHQ